MYNTEKIVLCTSIALSWLIIQGSCTCSNVQATGVSQDDINTIVSTHNTLRSTVANGQQSGQPAAANMMQIVWNQDIANEAQSWANNCAFQHGCNDCTPGGFSSMGQNLYQTSSSVSSPNADWVSAINGWYSEVSSFNPNNISPFQFSDSNGHYTQVVWADTYAVGCGYVSYYDGSYWYNDFYVCNYGPAGNWIGGTMYIVGQSCTQCPAGTTLCANGLCVNPS